MKNLNLTLALITTLGVSGLAIAGDHSDTKPSTVAELWAALDANKDGVISQEEAKSSDELTKQWSSLDLDQDGNLSEKEFALIK